MKIKAFSIVVPAYKQEKTIVSDVENLKGIADQIKYPVEIIFVVDGIVDKTLQLLSKKIKKYPNFKVLSYKKNKGKGYAVRFGMEKSCGEIVGFIDAGMDIDPQGLLLALKEIEKGKSDIVIGSKKHPQSKITYPFQRKIISFVYQKFVKILFHMPVDDTQVGLKIYKREVLNKILPMLVIDGFTFDIEMLTLAYKLGYQKIQEIPVKVNLIKGNTSKIMDTGMFKNIIEMFVDTLKVFLKYKNL